MLLPSALTILQVDPQLFKAYWIGIKIISAVSLLFLLINLTVRHLTFRFTIFLFRPILIVWQIMIYIRSITDICSDIAPRPLTLLHDHSDIALRPLEQCRSNAPTLLRYCSTTTLDLTESVFTCTWTYHGRVRGSSSQS